MRFEHQSKFSLHSLFYSLNPKQQVLVFVGVVILCCLGIVRGWTKKKKKIKVLSQEEEIVLHHDCG